MADREPITWITVNGNHIPVYEGESRQDAFNRYKVEKSDREKREQIALNKAQANNAKGKYEPLKEITNDSVLVYVGGQTVSSIVIDKDGKKYTNFHARGKSVKYRLNKENGEVQVSPYWNVIKGMYLV